MYIVWNISTFDICDRLSVSAVMTWTSAATSSFQGCDFYYWLCDFVTVTKL